MDPSNSIPCGDGFRPFRSRLFQTVGRAFADPLRLFSRVPAGDLGRPLLYGVITGTVAMRFSLMWNLMFGGVGMLIEEADAAEFAVSTAATGLFLCCCPCGSLATALGLFGGLANLVGR